MISRTHSAPSVSLRKSYGDQWITKTWWSVSAAGGEHCSNYFIILICLLFLSNSCSGREMDSDHGWAAALSSRTSHVPASEGSIKCGSRLNSTLLERLAQVPALSCCRGCPGGAAVSHFLSDPSDLWNQDIMSARTNAETGYHKSR